MLVWLNYFVNGFGRNANFSSQVTGELKFAFRRNFAINTAYRPDKIF